MLDKKKAPDYPVSKHNAMLVTSGAMVSIYRCIAAPSWEAFRQNGNQFQIILIEKTGEPDFVIDEAGHGRLVRPRERQTIGRYHHVYVSAKNYSIATPFEQPHSVLLLAYEQALADWKRRCKNVSHTYQEKDPLLCPTCNHRHGPNTECQENFCLCKRISN